MTDETVEQEQKSEPSTSDASFTVPLPTTGPNAAPKWVQEAVRKQPWRGGLEPCGEHEYTVDPLSIDGHIPPECKGTLYRCGPGRIRIGNSKFGHWFDGDGMVYALTVEGSNKGARFVCKWVRTPAFEKRQKSAGEGSINIKGVWTQADGGLLANLGAPANPVNTSIIKFCGSLMALCEGGEPMAIHPSSLVTLGFLALGTGASFSAHPKVDPFSGDLFNHGTAMGPNALLDIVPVSLKPLSPDAPRRSSRKDHEEGPNSMDVPFSVHSGSPVSLGSPSLVHDSALSPSYHILCVPPYSATSGDRFNMLLGLSSLGQKLTFKPSEPSRFLIFSRDTLSLVADLPLPSFSSYHFCNAFEEEGKLHVLVNVQDGHRDILEGIFKDMYGSSWCREAQNTIWEYVWDTTTWQLESSRPALHSSPVGSGQVTKASDETHSEDTVADEQLKLESRQVPPPMRIDNSTVHCNEAASLDGIPLGMEFPMINSRFVTRKSRYVYVLASKPEPELNIGSKFGYLNCIQKYDLQARVVAATHVLPPGCYANDTSFISKQGTEEEDGGYIVSFIYDSRSHKTDVIFIDAQRFSNPPVATIHLPTHVPYYFHGCWAPKE